MKRIALMAAGIVFVFASAGISAGADFNGDGKDDIALFRPSSGMWVIRNYTRTYLGQGGDVPLAYELSGSTTARPAVFRPSEGFFAVQGMGRFYLGGAGDIPIGQGYGPNPGPYDYIVRPGDAADLASALQSDSYSTVFIPEGTYVVSQVITVDNVRQIVGASNRRTVVQFTGSNNLIVNEDYCRIANLQFEHEAADPSFNALLDVGGNSWITVENCRFDGNDNVQTGLYFDGSSSWLQVLNCYAVQLTTAFAGDPTVQGSVFSNCQANNCAVGFTGCVNVSSCMVDGNGASATGFSLCRRLSSCEVNSAGVGFLNCKNVAGCMVDGSAYSPDAGFRSCDNVSGCEAYGCTWGYQSCHGLAASAAGSCDDPWSGTEHRDTVSTWLY